jgi:hypothetical protein
MKALVVSLVLLLGVSVMADEIARADDGRLQLSLIRQSPSSTPGPKHFFATHWVVLRNISTTEITVPVFNSTESAKPRGSSFAKGGALMKEEYGFTFDLYAGPDGSAVIRPDAFVTLRPGESALLPYFLGFADAEEFLPEFLVTYEVSSKYGARHGCWSGRLAVTQGPVVLYPAKKKPNQTVEPTAPSGRG